MPYTMTHLIIADKVSNTFTKQITNLPQFFLGNLAPDAVHQRAEYTSDFKKKSHLCPGPEPWGTTTDNEGWKQAVVDYLYSQEEFVNRDFILGYCCHLLSDIYNNMVVWMPFQEKYPEEAAKWSGNRFNNEVNKLDIELAITHKNRDFYWNTLRQSEGIDLPGQVRNRFSSISECNSISFLVSAEETEKQKNWILTECYMGKERQDITANQFVTYESTMDYINDAADFASAVLQEYFTKV